MQKTCANVHPGSWFATEQQGSPKVDHLFQSFFQVGDHGALAQAGERERSALVHLSSSQRTPYRAQKLLQWHRLLQIARCAHAGRLYRRIDGAVAGHHYTGIVSSPLLAHSLRSVMPSVSGIQISSRTRSGRACFRQLRAWPGIFREVLPGNLHRAGFRTAVRVCRFRHQQPGWYCYSYLGSQVSITKDS